MNESKDMDLNNESIAEPEKEEVDQIPTGT